MAEVLSERGGLNEKFDPESRIIGGEPANINQFPWTVSVRQFGAHHCGGSIIRPNRVLTAASCVPRNTPANLYTVRAGSNNNNVGGQLLQVADFVVHPNFVADRFRSNIAIIFMAGVFNTANPAIAVIALPSQGAGVATGVLAQVTGWGETAIGGAYSPLLRVVSVPIVAQNTCVSNYAHHVFPLSQDMLCAGFPAGGRGFCTGDIGGPLTLGAQLAGIASFNVVCAAANYPGVFTRVSFFSNWINANV